MTPKDFPGNYPAARRKQLAEEAIGDVLAAVSRGFWPFDDWTRHCLATAITDMQAGRYDAARIDAAAAICPIESRDPTYVASGKPNGIQTVGDLKRELAKLRTQPVSAG